MNKFLNPTLITPKSFQKTIESDKQVARWYLLLIFQPQAIADIKEDAEIWKMYGRMRTFLFLCRFMLLIGLSLTLFYLWIGGWGFVIAILPFALLCYKWNVDVKKCLAKISLFIVLKHFDERQFESMTLYKVSEMLADHYQIPSLVETISALDTVMRNVLIGTAVLVVIVYPLTFWKGVASIVILYFLAELIVGTTSIYKNLIK